jgi:hypothetical protein
VRYRTGIACEPRTVRRLKEAATDRHGPQITEVEIESSESAAPETSSEAKRAECVPGSQVTVAESALLFSELLPGEPAFPPLEAFRFGQRFVHLELLLVMLSEDRALAERREG